MPRWHTRNFAGTVDPCLKTLVPWELMGCRMECHGAPRHVPPAAYLMPHDPLESAIAKFDMSGL